MLLALKISDAEGAKMKNVCAAYHKSIAKVYGKDPGFFDDEEFNKLKDQIIKHESKLLKVINFKMEIPIPYPVVEKMMSLFFNSKTTYIS
jgi:hypothetical protein